MLNLNFCLAFCLPCMSLFDEFTYMFAKGNGGSIPRVEKTEATIAGAHVPDSVGARLRNECKFFDDESIQWLFKYLNQHENVAVDGAIYVGFIQVGEKRYHSKYSDCRNL